MASQVSRAVIQGASAPALWPFVERDIGSQVWAFPCRSDPEPSIVADGTTPHPFVAPPLSSMPSLLPWSPYPLQNIIVCCECSFLLSSSLIPAENCVQYCLDHTKLPITGEDTFQLSVKHGFSLSICFPSIWLESNQKNKKTTKIT